MSFGNEAVIEKVIFDFRRSDFRSSDPFPDLSSHFFENIWSFSLFEVSTQIGCFYFNWNIVQLSRQKSFIGKSH